MIRAIYGILGSTPFLGKLDKLEKAAAAYFRSPVKVSIGMSLVNPESEEEKVMEDTMEVFIVDVAHRFQDPSIVVVTAKVAVEPISISKVKTVGKSSAHVNVFDEGDAITMVVDTKYGMAIIIRNTSRKGDVVNFDSLPNVVPRLQLPSEGLPMSKGNSVSWVGFDILDNVDNNDSGNNGDSGDNSGDNGDNDGSGDGDGSGSGS